MPSIRRLSIVHRIAGCAAVLAFSGMLPMSSAHPANAIDTPPVTALVIHGGAGVIERSDLSVQDEAAIRADLDKALDAGQAVLDGGGDALDAVQAAVQVLEDSPHFNAGRGAVYNAEGRHELDASIMQGHTRRAGAVAGVTTIRNPIALARRVMEQSPHVMLIGGGAEAFADGMPTSSGSTTPGSTPRIGWSSCARPRHVSASTGNHPLPTLRISTCVAATSAPSARWRWTGTAIWRRPRPPAA